MLSRNVSNSVEAIGTTTTAFEEMPDDFGNATAGAEPPAATTAFARRIRFDGKANFNALELGAGFCNGRSRASQGVSPYKEETTLQMESYNTTPTPFFSFIAHNAHKAAARGAGDSRLRLCIAEGQQRQS